MINNRQIIPNSETDIFGNSNILQYKHNISAKIRLESRYERDICKKREVNVKTGYVPRKCCVIAPCGAVNCIGLYSNSQFFKKCPNGQESFDF